VKAKRGRRGAGLRLRLRYQRRRLMAARLKREGGGGRGRLEGAAPGGASLGGSLQDILSCWVWIIK